MVNHIVSWNLQETVVDDREVVSRKVKELLEGLSNVVQGIISIKVIINEMESSTVDLTLVSKFETIEALNEYQISEGHKKVGEYVGKVCCNRTCIDYIE